MRELQLEQCVPFNFDSIFLSKVCTFISRDRSHNIFEVSRKRKFYVTPVDKFLFLTSAVKVFTI